MRRTAVDGIWEVAAPKSHSADIPASYLGMYYPAGNLPDKCHCPLYKIQLMSTRGTVCPSRRSAKERRASQSNYFLIVETIPGEDRDIFALA